jgi:hypothetical protein
MKQSNQTKMWYSNETGINIRSDRAKLVSYYPYNRSPTWNTAASSNPLNSRTANVPGVSSSHDVIPHNFWRRKKIKYYTTANEQQSMQVTKLRNTNAVLLEYIIPVFKYQWQP